MILEQEEILFWKWRSGTPQYLHFAQYLEKQENQEWEGLAGGKTKKIKDKRKIESLEQKVDILLDVITVLQRDTTTKLDEQKKRFDSLIMHLAANKMMRK